MRTSLIILVLSVINSLGVFSLDVIVKNDNNQPRLSGYVERPDWEESKILKPDGPCIVKKIQIYFVGSQSGTDTILIAGDPSEGALPPTLWVADFNLKTNPIIFNYNGVAGWYEFPAGNIYLGGLDRIVVQHRLKQQGPWFAIDGDGSSQPYSSFLMNPNETNQLGGPGVYYLASADFMVRLLVEYIYPFDSTSQQAPPPTLFDATEESGLTKIGSSDVSVVDWNNDGFDDIAVGGNFFQNNGDRTFSTVTSKFGISTGTTSWGDFNNDGFIDCYALRNGTYDENLKMVFSQDRIYRNNGNGTFTQLNSRALFKLPYPNPSIDFQLANQFQNDSIPNPYNCITPLWFDFNADGKLDLFLANNRVGININSNYVERYFPDELWIQDSSGKFENASQSAGIKNFELFSNNQSALGYYDCYGANACDYNNDGKIDVFIANYRLVRDLLLKNNGNGTFTNVGDVTGVQGVPTAAPNYFGHGMGSEWGDFNNDGFPDLAVGNLGHPDWRGMFSNPSLIFRNQGPPNYNFTEVHSQMGLKFFEMNAGMTWVDLDLDGYLDLWHGQIAYNPEGSNEEPKRAGRIYINSGSPNFTLLDKTWELGCIVHGPWASARIDYDNDGDIDLLVASPHEGVKLFRNDIERKGNWIGFRLVGSPANRVNMDCYGTKIILFSGMNKYYRELMGSVSGTRCTQNSNLLHFGVGKVETIDSVVIVYPNGFKKSYFNIKTNQYYKVPYNGNLLPLKIATPGQIYPKNYQSNIPDSVELRWTKVNGAELYEVELTDLGSGTSNVQSSVSEQVVFKKLTRSNKYAWKVRALSPKDTSLWSSSWKFNVGNPLPKKVNLVAPANNSSGLATTLKFIWNIAWFDEYFVGTITYTIEISKNQNFEPITYSKDAIKDTFFIIESGILEPGTQYFWRVKSQNVDGDGTYSDAFVFETSPIPAKTILTSPVNNEDNVSVKPTFKWNATPNATAYRLEVATEQSFQTLVLEKDLQFPTFKTVKQLEYETEYFWRVRASNNVGAGEWSDVWRFKTQKFSSVETYEKLSDILIHPNPFNDILIINFTNKESLYMDELSIKDLLGRTILATEIKGENIELHTDSFSNGVYLLSIKNRNSSKIYNFLIVKVGIK